MIFHIKNDISNVSSVIFLASHVDLAILALEFLSPSFHGHSLNNTTSSFIHRLKIFHHIYSIAHMPHIDIPILAVCRMFIP